MATKSKVNFYSGGFKFIAFLFILAGTSIMALSLINIQNVALYLGEDDYIKNNQGFDASRELVYILKDLYNEDTPEQEKNLLKQKAAEYVSMGFRYFILADQAVIDDDGTLPKINARSDIYSQYGYPISSFSWESPEGHKTIFVTPTQEFLNSVKLSLTENIAIGETYFYYGLASIFLLLLGAFLTVLLCGRKERGGEITFGFFDRIYNDVLILTYVTCSSIIIFCCGAMWTFIIEGSLTLAIEAVQVMTALGIFAVSLLTFWTLSSVCKRIKSKQFFKYTLLWNAAVLAWKILKLLCSAMTNMAKNVWSFFYSPFVSFTGKTVKRNVQTAAVIVLLIIFFNTILSIFLAEGLGAGVVLWIVPSLALIIFGCVRLIFKQMGEFEEIKKGCAEIRSGNLSYKIPSLKQRELNIMAENINNIGEGLQGAVRSATVSEKMKTELITNVSHDLKTPLTSIISYVDLLSKEEGLSDEAKDYISVLKSKSERLKGIISDLFDLAKGTSGSAEVTIEKLDMKKLIVQTLAEMEDKVAASKQVIKQNLPQEEVFIYADGKRLYRVFQNIFDNALKYSLPGTRIFVNMSCESGKVIAAVQNIAAYEMNFNEGEILERFSRGDKARATDGTGLGLSIAQTFTGLCGGTFNVEIDGDQFKVFIEFATC